MRRYQRATWLTLLAVVAIAFLFGDRLLGFTVDWLWFGEMGQRGVFWRVVSAQAELALVFGLLLFAILYLNLRLAHRTAPPLTRRLHENVVDAQLERFRTVGVRWLILGGSIVAGILAALDAAGHWEEFLKFQNPQRFGMQDPVFHHDLGFYLFTLPFWKYLYGWCFIALALATVAAAVVYFATTAVQVMQGYTRVALPVRVHLSILLGLLAVVGAWGYRLAAFDLLSAGHARFFGAGYTDVHARLPALNILTVVALIAAAGFFVNAFHTRALWLPGLALALMFVASITVGGLYPSMLQRFEVQPNEANLESPFISNNIRMTRAAFGIDRLTPQLYRLGGTPTPALRQREADTLSDIRLWDYRALAPTYRQLQGLRNYYDLSRIDIDRYTLEGKERQVMLAARELDSSRLNSTSWVNETLQFTHGYGLVMNPVNEVTENGQPRFIAGGLPLQAADPKLIPQRPQIYYGEITTRPVVAPSQTEEFDYALEEQKAVSRFDGRTGLPLGSFGARALFAAYLHDSNLVLSSQITSASRLLIRRRIDERAARIAPFLAFDHDPYLVSGPDRLYWIQDAYTVSDAFPYVEPLPYDGARLRRWTDAGLDSSVEGGFNYIRNSVKVVVDAYSGRTEYYVYDAADPLLRAYRAIFPGLFKDGSEMPPFLREHVRYPEDLFTIQARELGKFHVTDPLVFYNQSSFWDLPYETLEQSGEAGATRAPMEPYYVTMRLPGEPKVEYALIQPFVFRGQQNMSAWLAARCDPSHLGEMRLFAFDTYVKGPELIEQAIQSKPAISSALSLLNREGSRVIWGNLLVLPLEGTLLYVRPLYLSATATDHGEAMREFQRVVLAQGEQVVMAPSLDEALDQIFHGQAPAAATTTPSAATAPPAPAAPGQPAGSPVRQRAMEADESFRAAQQALQRNDWTSFGRNMDKAQHAIAELRRLTGGGAR